MAARVLKYLGNGCKLPIITKKKLYWQLFMNRGYKLSVSSSDLWIFWELFWPFWIAQPSLRKWSHFWWVSAIRKIKLELLYLLLLVCSLYNMYLHILLEEVCGFLFLWLYFYDSKHDLTHFSWTFLIGKCGSDRLQRLQRKPGRTCE